MKKISLIGIGYVGLPLAKALQKYYKVVGFDKSIKRIKELNNGKDINNQFTKKDLKVCKNLTFTGDQNKLYNTDIFIVTVPTPILKNKKPDLSHLKKSL